MSDPLPTQADVTAAFDAARADAAAREEDAAAREELVRELPARIERRTRILIVWGLVAGMVLAFLTALAAVALAREAQTNSEAAVVVATATQKQVDAALAKLNEANDELMARGQAPVPAPREAEPAEAIAAAVLAQVLAQLPPVPTADEVAQRIVPAVTANVLGPTRAELAEQVAAYLQANPPPPGVDGEDGVDGEPGRPPTQEEIDAAVAAYLQAHPPPPGPQGVGVSDVAAETRDEHCVLVFTLTDPATGASSEDVVPVADRVCADGLIG